MILPSLLVQSVKSSWLRLRKPLAAAPTGCKFSGAMTTDVVDDDGNELLFVLTTGQKTSNWHLKWMNLNGMKRLRPRLEVTIVVRRCSPVDSKLVLVISIVLYTLSSPMLYYLLRLPDTNGSIYYKLWCPSGAPPPLPIRNKKLPRGGMAWTLAFKPKGGRVIVHTPNFQDEISSFRFTCHFCLSVSFLSFFFFGKTHSYSEKIYKIRQYNSSRNHSMLISSSNSYDFIWTLDESRLYDETLLTWGFRTWCDELGTRKKDSIDPLPHPLQLSLTAVPCDHQVSGRFNFKAIQSLFPRHAWNSCSQRASWHVYSSANWVLIHCFLKKPRSGRAGNASNRDS